MNWQVIETQYFSKFESPKEKIVAQFDTLVLAEDFVNLVIRSAYTYDEKDVCIGLWNR